MTGLGEEDVRAIRRSWARVVPAVHVAVPLFYGRLFRLEPGLRALFPADMHRQSEKLCATLDAVVASLDDLDAFLPVARALAVRHVGYGAQPHHYDLVGAALLWMLEQSLGADFDEPTRRAWTRAYGLLAEAMIDAAWPVRAVTGAGAGGRPLLAIGG